MSGNAQHKHWPPQRRGCWRLGSCDIDWLGHQTPSTSPGSDCGGAHTRNGSPGLAQTTPFTLLNSNSCHQVSPWMLLVRPWALTPLWTHLPSYSLMFRVMIFVIFKLTIESPPPTVIGNLSPVQWSCNRPKVDIFPWSSRLQIAIQRNVRCPLPR